MVINEDHHRAVAAAIRKPPSDWKRPPVRPNHTRLRATELDLRPLNIGSSYTRDGRQPLENTGIRLWTRLRSRSHENREEGGMGKEDERRKVVTLLIFILIIISIPSPLTLSFQA